MSAIAKAKAALKKMLTDAAKSRGKSAFHFVYSPGKKGYMGLIVSRKPITKDQKDEAQEAGGGAPFLGRVVGKGDSNLLTFVTKGGEAAKFAKQLRVASKDAGYHEEVEAASQDEFKELEDGEGEKSEKTQAGDIQASVLPNAPGGSEKDQLLKLAEDLRSFKQSGKTSDGTPVWTGTWNGKQCHITQKAYDQMHAAAEEAFQRGIGRIRKSADAALSFYNDLAKLKQADLFSKVFYLFVETVKVSDPGPIIKLHIDAARHNLDLAESNAHHHQYHEAAPRLIEADQDASASQRLAEGYYKGSVSMAGTSITVLEGVKTTCTGILAVAAIVGSGGVAAAAIVGGAAIEIAEGSAGYLTGYDDKIDWGKVAGGVTDIVLTKFKLAEKVEAAVIDKLRKSPMFQKLKTKITAYVNKHKKKFGRYADEITDQMVKEMGDKLEEKAGAWVGEKVEELVHEGVQKIAQRDKDKDMTWGALATQAQQDSEEKLLAKAEEEVGAEFIKDNKAIEEAAAQFVKSLLERQGAGKK